MSRTSFLFIKKSGSLNIFGRNREISYICFGKQFEITFIQYKKTKHEKNSFNGDRRAVRSNGSTGGLIAIWVGPVDNLDEAVALQRKLQNDGYETLIVTDDYIGK